MNIENAIYDFLQAAVAAAAEGDALYNAELHATAYQTVTSAYGVRVGDCESSIAPGPGGEAEEYDAELSLLFFAHVGVEPGARAAARQQVTELTLAVARLVFEDGTLGGRVRSSLPGRVRRGFDTIDGASYAVADLPLYVNHSSASIEERRDRNESSI